MKNSLVYLPILCLALLMITSCDKLDPSGPEESEILDGPIEDLDNAESRLFLEGDISFNDEVFTTESGLGPLFVATSCASCHAGDGKGHPFSSLTRFGQSAPGQNGFLDLGGPQLQNRAIPGFEPEQIPSGASFSVFTPPAVTGLGLLELVSDEDILAMSDPNDSDADGISGVPNWLEIPSFVIPFSNAIPQNGRYIHRFGKKAAAYNLLHQTVNAYNQDMGVTSVFVPIDPFSGLEEEPEVDINTVNNVVFYLQTLKAPIQRNPGDPEIQEGRSVFERINCSGCHMPTLRTGVSNVEALSEMEFHPFTDLLLHDMGPDLDDGYTEGNAETFEWRTPPLWGLGLSPNSQGGEFFLLHDGRARSIEEAVLFHGGEALQSKNDFEALTESDRQALLAFLKSL